MPSSEATADAPTPTPTGKGWRFENVYTYFDDEFLEFYVQGDLVNDTEDDARIVSFWPVILGADGVPVTSKGDVDAIAQGYKELRESISLAPGQSLAFSFLVDVPIEISIEDNYDFIVASEQVEAGRDDLDITDDAFDDSDWPYAFFVEGTYANPGSDLTTYVAIVVTLYNVEGQVLGVGWSLETSVPFLSAGEHGFEVSVDVWEGLDHLELEVYSYKVQVFGY
jgi:hypothetical protein